jgi:hypothetical protein
MNTRTSTIGTLTTGQSTIVTFLLAGLVLSAIPHASSVARGGERMGVLSGRIVSLDGQPVEHAHVTLEQLDLPKVEAVSGPDGRFRMPLEPVCHVRWLFVDADGFARERWDDVTVFPNRANDLGDIALWKGRRLQGHVLDLDGKPRAGVRVIAESARYALCHSSNPIGTWETTTEGDGSFVTHPLPLGVVYVKAMCAERQLAETTTKIVPGSGDQRLDPIRLQKDQPLVGIVVDEQGQPIEGVDVSSQIPVPRVVSDKTGRFPIRGYGPGMPFSPDFVKAGYFDDLPGGWFNDLKVDRATSSVTFTLKKAVPFEGRVVDAETGKPVAIRRIGLCDAVRKPDGKIETTRCALLKFQQPEPGHFRAALTRRGDYLLTVMAEGYDNFEEFVPGDTRGSVRTFRLRKEIPNRPEQVSQHLEAADNGLRQERVAGIIRYRGKPVADAWVSLCPAWAKEENLMNAAVRRGRGVPHQAFARAKCLSRADGSYSLYPPHPGRWFVQVDRADCAPTLVGPIAIGKDESRSLDIACVDGGTIRGVVRNVSPDLLPQLWVVAFDRGVFKAESRVHADGTFKLDHVPAGECGLKVGHDGYEDPELPWGPFMHRPDKDKLFDTFATPWKGATVVHVQPDKPAEGIELDLPRR